MSNFYNPTPQKMGHQAQSLWMPYTQMTAMPPPLLIERAEGVTLYPQHAPPLLDTIASWWCVIHGYNHPHLNAAITTQLSAFSHIMMGGLVHEPARQLADVLAHITPGDLQHVFFSDSGSVGVEVAIKMAVQYWRNQGKDRHQLAYLMGGYHGDTTGAMSVCDPVEGMHHLFSPLLPAHIALPRPPVWGCPFEEIEQYSQCIDACLLQYEGRLAAMIVEPICQCAGGFYLYDPQALQVLARACQRHDLLLIADEVATGFGRVGPLFACELAGVTPDIMVLGKGLTGGYLGLAATIATPRVFEGFKGDGSKALMHGPTFMGNALACAVALASIELCMDPTYLSSIQAIQTQLMALHEFEAYPCIESVRVKGAMGALSFRHPLDTQQIQQMGLDSGIWCRPIGRVLYTSPATVITPEGCQHIISGFHSIAASIDSDSDY